MRIFFAIIELAAAVLLVSCTVVKTSPAEKPQQWRPVKAGKLLGISGIALIDPAAKQPVFLIVHDTKGRKVYTARVTSKDGALQYEPLDWMGFKREPNDLEALTRVPGDTSFMALASKGRVYHIRIRKDPKGRDAIQVLNEFQLPNPDNKKNFEGFSLQALEDDVLAVWAYRGKNKKLARIYWGLLQPARDKVIFQDSEAFKAPWPTTCRVSADKECGIRHVSDLSVDSSGLLYISSAADPGDDGPFDSAVYIAGKFQRADNQFHLQLRSPLTELFRFEDRKVEAIEILGSDPPTFVFGSDDENKGGSIYVD